MDRILSGEAASITSATFGDGFEGTKVAGFSASTEINRRDFGVTGGAAGAVVGDKITILLEIEAVKQA